MAKTAAKRLALTDELKAKAIALLTTGDSNSTVCQKTGLQPDQVSRIKSSLSQDDLKTIVETKKDKYGDLIDRLLEESLNSQILQVRHMGDKDWLKRQNAADLAVMFGVLNDKAIRLLVAKEAAAGVSDVAGLPFSEEPCRTISPQSD